MDTPSLRQEVGSEVIKKINPHILQFIQFRERNLAAKLHPRLLLNRNRFDLMAKYIYAKFQESGIDSDWGLHLYYEHIRAFNNFQEPGSAEKAGKDAFIAAFHSILDSIKEGGFDEDTSIVPVIDEKLILDGSHRTVACLLYDKEVACLFVDINPLVDRVVLEYNYSYFREKGLANKCSDAMALEYCRLKSNTYIATVFPSAVGKDEQVKKVIQEYGEIIYEKSVHLSNEGPINLIKQIYGNENWLGNWSDNFSGARAKAAACFRYDGLARVFIIESDSVEKVTEAKAKIRKLFGIEKHSVHINDTHEETIHLAQILLNDNSIHFLNYARPKNYEKFYQLLEDYQEWLTEKNLDKERFCIDSSAVMAAYGIREPGDLDFLHYRNEGITSGNPDIESNNDKQPYHAKPVDDIIYNPENHFYYNGLKFATLDVIKNMKQNKRELKDLEDINKIDAFLAFSQSNRIRFYLKQLFNPWNFYIASRRILMLLRKAKMQIVKALPVG
jgi:hypothetical protein